MSSNAIRVILIGGIGEYGKLSKCAAHIPYVHVCPHIHKKVEGLLSKATFGGNFQKEHLCELHHTVTVAFESNFCSP